MDAYGNTNIVSQAKKTKSTEGQGDQGQSGVDPQVRRFGCSTVELYQYSMISQSLSSVGCLAIELDEVVIMSMENIFFLFQESDWSETVRVEEGSEPDLSDCTKPYQPDPQFIDKQVISREMVPRLSMSTSQSTSERGLVFLLQQR